MSFVSIEFILFFVIVYSGTYFIQKCFPNRVKEYFLLLASYFFYGWWDWRFCFLLLFVTIVSYLTAKHTDKKSIYITGVLMPLIVLGFFKYFNFFLSSFTALIGHELGTLNIILPIGISFYTFQALSYVIDVHRGKIKVEDDFIKLALYLSFFPQLVAGPIVKASEFLPQLYEDRRITADRFKYGIQVFMFGLFKKIVLADRITIIVNDVFSKPVAFQWSTIILAVVSNLMVIYFDFSGYSDMAIGCAHCFGYDFKRNFNLPFLSKNISEIWARWHISLSTWLKEYVYIPLGGNRKGKTRQYINLFLTSVVSGLWHGAGWTYVCLGVLNGVALCTDKFMQFHTKKHRRIPLVNILMTNAAFMLICIFFRASNFKKAWEVLKGIFTLQQGIRQPYLWSFVGIVIVIVSSLTALIRAKKKDEKFVDGFYPIVNLDKMSGQIAFLVFSELTLGLAYAGSAPFIYFQF